MEKLIKFTLIIFCVAVCSTKISAQENKTASSSAQSAQTNRAAPHITAMKKLDFLVGNWQGKGWMTLGANRRENFTINESVQPKLGGAVVLVEGVGKNERGETVHNALGLISFDPQANSYRFKSHIMTGDSLETIPQITDKSWVWGMKQAGGETRFTITLNDKGHWYEIGEFSPDGGKQWFKILEMELERVK